MLGSSKRRPGERESRTLAETSATDLELAVESLGDQLRARVFPEERLGAFARDAVSVRDISRGTCRQRLRELRELGEAESPADDPSDGACGSSHRECRVRGRWVEPGEERLDLSAGMFESAFVTADLRRDTLG